MRFNYWRLLLTFIGVLTFCMLVYGNDTPIFDTINSADDIVYYSSEFLAEYELDKAKDLIDFGLEKYSRQNDEYTWLKLTYLLADYYYYEQEYFKARKLYEDILPLTLEHSDTIIHLNTQNSIGLIYSFENNREKALSHYLSAIELFDNIAQLSNEYKALKLVTLTNVLSLEFPLDDNSLLHKISAEAVGLAEDLNDSLHLGIIYNALAVDCKGRDDFSGALVNYREALSIFTKMDEEYHSAHIMNNLGALYDYYGFFDTAFYYYDISLAKFESVNYQRGILSSNLGIASVLIGLYDYDKARPILHRVIDDARKYRFNTILLEAYSELSSLEYNSENYKEAFDVNKLYAALNDSIYSLESQQKYDELLARIDIVQKEKEIELLRNEKLRQESKITRSTREKQLAISFIILLVIIVYIIIMSYRQKIRANMVLVEKNEKIALQNKQLIGMNDRVSNINKELQQSRHELMVSNNSKNRFFSILAHDLKNPLHTVSGFSFLLSNQYDKLEENERMQYSHDIYSSCIQLNRLLENLLEWSRTQTNEIVFNPTIMDIKQVVGNVVKLLEPVAHEKSIEIVNEIERPKVIKADVHMLETVFRNLINNGIKFTKRGGSISINAEFKNNILIVTFADNGIGIAKSELSKLFWLESKTRNLGTENEKGTGLGLVICKEFVAYHGGKIYAESVINKGSVFFVELPYEPHEK